MTSLTEIYFENNKIKEINPLKNMVNLEKLNFQYNQISNVDALHAGHVKLRTLLLGNNLIKDVSPLKQLTNLTTLDLEKNKIKADQLYCPTDSHITDMNKYCEDLIKKTISRPN